MQRKGLTMIAVATVCTAMGVLAQTPTADDPLKVPGTIPSDATSRLSPTGRMEHQAVRGSKLIGAQVKSASGEELGTINDVIVNPTTARIDFAVLALTSTTGAANTGEKLVPVPWSLLRPSVPVGYGTTSKAGANEQAFAFTGDHTKLQSAPSFDQNSWPDISTPEWRQSVFSYYGVQPGSATGARFQGGRSPGTGTSPGTPPDSSTYPNPK